ncbi:MAG: SLOG family protein [Clostridia bacterium]
MQSPTYAFIGHRPSTLYFGYDEAHPGCLRVKSVMRTAIDMLIARGVDTFLTGVAQGAGIWGAEIVLEIKKTQPELCLIAVIPCDGQVCAWPAPDRARYAHILAACDDIIRVGHAHSGGNLLARDRYLVAHADGLLAVYDGSATGDTAYTVRLARARHRPLLIIDPRQADAP